VLLSPKIIVSKVYDGARGDKPVPLDDNRIRKKLGWWNDEWRKKLLAFVHWLAEEQEAMRISVGYQEILISARPRRETLQSSYRERSDDDVIREIMSWADV
jgi:hypothetical protein